MIYNIQKGQENKKTQVRHIRGGGGSQVGSTGGWEVSDQRETKTINIMRKKKKTHNWM